MARLKLNLPTGASVEKPVITCFNVEDKSYLILDAENIGSMGLPIILVCKIENNKVTKITDAAEWQKAKDYLKGIIAGNSMNYIAVPNEIAADEVYYTQLTLPVASFDVIKNAYKVEGAAEEAAPVVEPIAESAPVIEPVVADITPVAPVANEEAINPAEPVINIEMPSAASVEPIVSVVPEAPVIPETPITPAAPVSDPVVSVVDTPAVENTSSNSEIDFTESKEAFMKACENMFDALVAKFQAQLDSKK